MSLYERMYDLVEAQGWDDNTVLDLALSFIEEQAKGSEFMGYLRAAAKDENETPDEWVEGGEA